MVSEEVPDDAVRCLRWVVPGDCVRVFSRRSLRNLDIAAQKWLCQNTHGRDGVSKSFAKMRASVVSFGILGVKLKTRRLYASSGNGVESFYTGSVGRGRSSGPGVATSGVPKSTVRSPTVKLGPSLFAGPEGHLSALARLPAW